MSAQTATLNVADLTWRRTDTEGVLTAPTVFNGVPMVATAIRVKLVEFADEYRQDPVNPDAAGAYDRVAELTVPDKPLPTITIGGFGENAEYVVTVAAEQVRP